jgi:hypothetical protein
MVIYIYISYLGEKTKKNKSAEINGVWDALW